MDEQSKQLLGQLASVMISGLFTYLQQQGLTPDEIDEQFLVERQKFKARPPKILPDA